MKKDLKRAQCFTSPRLVRVAMSLVPRRAWQGANVLEPSAGNGAFVRAILKRPVASLVAIELDQKYADELQDKYGLLATVVHADALKWLQGDYVCDDCPAFIKTGCDKNPGCTDHLTPKVR